jgi:hypothetical protein
VDGVSARVAVAEELASVLPLVCRKAHTSCRIYKQIQTISANANDPGSRRGSHFPATERSFSETSRGSVQLNQRQPRLIVELPAQVGWLLDEDDFQGRTHSGLDEVSTMGRGILFRDHDMGVDRRFSVT